MEGKVIVVGHDVDTDQIIPSQYLLTTIDQMKAHTFETLLPDFVEMAKNCPILVAGENFGCGSSREQAPTVLKALGIQLIIAKSFARIFYRNAINIGLHMIVCSELHDKVNTNDTISVQVEHGTVTDSSGQIYTCTATPNHMAAILEAGGLIAYLNEREG